MSIDYSPRKTWSPGYPLILRSLKMDASIQISAATIQETPVALCWWNHVIRTTGQERNNFIVFKSKQERANSEIPAPWQTRPRAATHVLFEQAVIWSIQVPRCFHSLEDCWSRAATPRISPWRPCRLRRRKTTIIAAGPGQVGVPAAPIAAAPAL